MKLVNKQIYNREGHHHVDTSSLLSIMFYLSDQRHDQIRYHVVEHIWPENKQ